LLGQWRRAMRDEVITSHDPITSVSRTIPTIFTSIQTPHASSTKYRTLTTVARHCQPPRIAPALLSINNSLALQSIYQTNRHPLNKLSLTVCLSVCLPACIAITQWLHQPSRSVTTTVLPTIVSV
jgi:hypothetical protein